MGGCSRSCDSGCCHLKEVHKTPFLLDRFVGPLLCLLDGDKDDAVALGVHLTELVLHLVGGGGQGMW